MLINDINHILFIRENNKPCYVWEYCLNILIHNPIRENEILYFKGLKSMKDSTGLNIGWFNFNNNIWVYVWDLYFKQNNNIMVEIENGHYYINKEGVKIC